MNTALQEITSIVERVKKHNNNWSFGEIAQVKRLEQQVKAFPADFNRLRYAYNRDMAYQLNVQADIKVFLEELGYARKHSTRHWARYEKGKSILLVTDSNGFKDVKTGETGNLFKLIEQECGRAAGMTQTEFFIRKVAGCSLAERTGEQHKAWEESRAKEYKTAQEGAQPKEHKEFSIDDYRLEKLNAHKNYLCERGITTETLRHPNFEGTVLQGNRKTNVSGAAIPRWQNNIIYPFKNSPEAAGASAATLLQQFGRKMEYGGKMVDKVFAAGGGKAQSAWFSNVPPKAEHLYVFENPLDAMSHYQLHQPDNALYMATGGRPAAGQLALIDEVAKKYGIARKHLAFDNDTAGHVFDAQYLAHKTPQYRINQNKDGGYTVEYKNLHPEQYFAMKDAAKDKPNAEFVGDGSVKVKVNSAEELAKCNKYCARYLIEDKSIDFVKSQSKDFNDDLRSAFGSARTANTQLSR